MSNPFLERAKQFGLQTGESGRARQISIDLPPPPVGYTSSASATAAAAAIKPNLTAIPEPVQVASSKIDLPVLPSTSIASEPSHFKPPPGQPGPPPPGGSSTTTTSASITSKQPNPVTARPFVSTTTPSTVTSSSPAKLPLPPPPSITTTPIENPTTPISSSTPNASKDLSQVVGKLQGLSVGTLSLPTLNTPSPKSPIPPPPPPETPTNVSQQPSLPTPPPATVAPTHKSNVSEIPPPPPTSPPSSADQSLLSALGALSGGKSNISICGGCSKPIQGKILELGDGSVYHPECYCCQRCKQPVTDSILMVNQKPYHEACVMCTTCGINLSNAPFSVHPQTGAIFCATHARQAKQPPPPSSQPPPPTQPPPPISATAQPPPPSMPPPPMTTSTVPSTVPLCQGCGQPATTGSIISAGTNLFYHEACLKCGICQTQLDASGRVYQQASIFYCESDYLRQFSHTCHQCKQAITDSTTITIGTDSNPPTKLYYHTSCFRCATCQTPLQGGGFFLKDQAVVCANCT